MHENTGIAHAQNVGIRHALECGADIIVFFDQDTKIDILFLDCLLAVVRDDAPLVLSPVYYDYVKGYEFPTLKLNKYGLPTKVFSKGVHKPYEVDIVISSGSAVTAATFVKVGLMDEDYFIDYVDIDWCIRCRAKNIPILVVPAAKMKHSIGDSSVNLGVLRGHIHSPVRSYYKIRNVFLLFR
jgi:rhamnosyltransferase